MSTGRKFFLSWSHYLKLMRIENIDERHFYEVEAVKNNWSLRELNRQFDAALYERLALSIDKEKLPNWIKLWCEENITGKFNIKNVDGTSRIQYTIDNEGKEWVFRE